MIPDPEGEEPLPLTPGFAMVLTLGGAFLQIVVLVLLSGASGELSPAKLGIAAIVGYGAVFAYGVQRIPPPPATALGLVGAPRLAWTAALFLVPSLLLVSELDNVMQAVYPLPEEVREARGPVEGLALIELAFVGIAVLPTIQELFFRGLIQPCMVGAAGRLRGILATAALAGMAALALGGPWALIVAFASGLVLSILRESAGSLLPGLALNVVFGVCSTLATQGVFGIPGFDDLSAPHTPLVWLVPAALATGVGLRVCQALLASRAAD